MVGGGKVNAWGGRPSRNEQKRSVDREERPHSLIPSCQVDWRVKYNSMPHVECEIASNTSGAEDSKRVGQDPSGVGLEIRSNTLDEDGAIVCPLIAYAMPWSTRYGLRGW